jgi:hypothetical protein
MKLHEKIPNIKDLIRLIGSQEMIPKEVGEVGTEVGGDGMDHTGEINHRTLAEEELRIVEEAEHDWDIVPVIEALSEEWCDYFD